MMSYNTDLMTQVSRASSSLNNRTYCGLPYKWREVLNTAPRIAPKTEIISPQRLHFALDLKPNKARRYSKVARIAACVHHGEINTSRQRGHERAGIPFAILKSHLSNPCIVAPCVLSNDTKQSHQNKLAHVQNSASRRAS